MKINFLEKKNSFIKKDFIFRPGFYWRIILLCAFIIISLSFLFSYYLFIQVSQESVLLSTNNSGELQLVNKDNLEKTLNYFSEKEKKSEEILNSPVPVVDPSL